MTFQPEAPTEQTVRIGDISFGVHASGEHRRYWDRVNAGEWEPHTFRVFRRFLDRESECIDFGAWIGPTALFAAHLAGRVHAIEPDPVAYLELTANVAANPHLAPGIMLHELCIAPEPGPVSLYTGGMYYSANSRFGDSMSGLLPAHGATVQPSRQVQGVRLEDFMAAQGIVRCGLIKMDVEGGEYELIPGRWRRLRPFGMPPLYVSFHTPAPARREALIGACLEELASCYQTLFSAADEAPFDVAATLSEVRDWGDEAPGSAWRQLELRLAEGLVGANT